MPRQLCCFGMCKISLWSDISWEKQQANSNVKFARNFITAIVSWCCPSSHGSRCIRLWLVVVSIQGDWSRINKLASCPILRDVWQLSSPTKLAKMIRVGGMIIYQWNGKVITVIYQWHHRWHWIKGGGTQVLFVKFLHSESVSWCNFFYKSPLNHIHIHQLLSVEYRFDMAQLNSPIF